MLPLVKDTEPAPPNSSADLPDSQAVIAMELLVQLVGTFSSDTEKDFCRVLPVTVIEGG